VPGTLGFGDQARLEQLPPASSIPPEQYVFADRVRDLVEATTLTSIGGDELAALIEIVNDVTSRLKASQRPEAVLLLRHDNGGVEHATQAGTGRLNPEAPRVEVLPPDHSSDGVDGFDGPVVRVTATLTAQHVGPPDRAHGGIVALLLDHVIGMAPSAAGMPGYTAGLDIRYKAATPLYEPVEIVAWLTGHEGRKRFAKGEIRHNGVVTAHATAVFVGAVFSELGESVPLDR
jgi:acyl-coenzyme A thioesterase PaaI-like protein